MINHETIYNALLYIWVTIEFILYANLLNGNVGTHPPYGNWILVHGGILLISLFPVSVGFCILYSSARWCHGNISLVCRATHQQHYPLYLTLFRWCHFLPFVEMPICQCHHTDAPPKTHGRIYFELLLFAFDSRFEFSFFMQSKIRYNRFEWWTGEQWTRSKNLPEKKTKIEL